MTFTSAYIKHIIPLDKLSAARVHADAEMAYLKWKVQRRAWRKKLVESGVVRFTKGPLGYEVHVYYYQVALLTGQSTIDKKVLEAIYCTIEAMRNTETIRRN